MDKEEIRKEFNDFLDSASDETIRDFLRFLKDRKEGTGTKDYDLKKELDLDKEPFKNRVN